MSSLWASGCLEKPTDIAALPCSPLASPGEAIPTPRFWPLAFACCLPRASLLCPSVSVWFRSVAQLCLTLCDPMDCSTPGLPVHHNSSSVVPFSSCLQSFPASGSLQTRQLFTSGGQRTGLSASASVLPMNIQDSFPLGWTGWISLLSKGLSRVFSNTTVQKHLVW